VTFKAQGFKSRAMADDEDYEEASPEQKLNIATYFVMSSPPGEVEEVVTDVKKLVADDNVLSDEALAKIMRGYNVEQMASAKDPEGDSNIIVSVHGQVAPNQYVDPATGRVLTFDHRRRQFTEVTEKKQVLNEAVDSYRRVIQDGVQGYVQGAYKEGKCALAVYGADTGAITIALSAMNVNLANFWSGGLRAIYSVDVNRKGSVKLKGSVKINVHYFEDGNVQLHTSVDKQANVDIGSPEDSARQIVAAISKIETEFQSNLEEMYVTMHSTTFKAMRRFLPINRQPMNWNAAAHALASEIKK